MNVNKKYNLIWNRNTGNNVLILTILYVLTTTLPIDGLKVTHSVIF